MLSINKKALVMITLFTALLVFVNYYFGLDEAIRKNNSFYIKLMAWYAVFLIAFAFSYLVIYLTGKAAKLKNIYFLLLLFLAPIIFALKISLRFNFQLTNSYLWNNYWDHIIYWPLLFSITASILFITWRIADRQQPFYGITLKGINWKPYWLMLLIMIPLISLASTQSDFLAVYPKLQSITGMNSDAGIIWWHILLYELAYGSDFITIELFFRGFLILAFIKWAGKDAILPMACFYCTIHFGKPLGECISSYFGGILLGIVVYNTRSIFGGLLVHLGIAWMMEVGGYIGHLFK